MKKIEPPAAEILGLELEALKFWFSRVCAVQKKCLTPESDFTGNFLWAPKKKIILKLRYVANVKNKKKKNLWKFEIVKKWKNSNSCENRESDLKG